MLIKIKEGLHFFAFERNDKIDADEKQRIAFALLSIDFWGVSFGIRIFRIYTGDHMVDDFFDRALLGVNINHGRLIIEIAFIRMQIC